MGGLTKFRIREVKLDQRSPEWFAWRLGTLTASRSAAILGESPYQTPYGVFCEMTGRTQGFVGNAATDQGEAKENPAVAAYEIHKGFIETRPVCVLHLDVDWIGASLDAYEDLTGIPAENKYQSEKSHQSALNGVVPRHHWIQVQHQLMCLPDAPHLDYWSYREENPVLIEVQHDREFQAHLFKTLGSFRELLLNDIPPPLTVDDDKIETNPEIIKVAQRLIALKALDDKITKKEKEEMDELKPIVIQLGQHDRIRCGRVLVTKSVTKTGKDSYRLTIAGDKAI